MRIIIYNILIAGLSVEILAFILSATHYIPESPVPSYFTGAQRSDTAFIDTNTMYGPRNIDTNVAWCTWHPVNGVTHQLHKGCIDAVMHFNSLGARGALPNSTDSAATIFLGDSFAEGYGIQDSETISEVYKHKTGLPVLNLGTSGKFGTTQMSVIYEHLCSTIRHNKVVICTYLRNDFYDNDISRHLKDRYCVYYVQDSAGNYSLKYLGSPDSSSFTRRQYNRMTARGYEYIRTYQSAGSYLASAKDIKDLILKSLQLSYSYKLMKHIKNRLFDKHIPVYTSNDLSLYRYTISRIVKTAHEHHAKVYLVNVPEKEYWQQNGYLTFYKKRDKDLQNSLRGIDLEILHFENYIDNAHVDPSSLYFSCDPHFNSAGAAMFGAFIAQSINK